MSVPESGPVRVTPRGFAIYAEFSDIRGGTVRVQQSSSAEGPHVWIFCQDSVDLPVSAHLDVEQAQIVRDALDQFIRSAR